jgi:hypothetical protein
VLRFVQAQGQREEIARRRRYWQPRAVRVHRIGVDGTAVKLAGQPEAPGVVVVVDEASGVGLWVEAADEQDPAALAELLAWVLKRFQPEEVVTDEGAAYPGVLAQAAAASEVNLHHRLCAAHFRRNKVGRLRHLRRTAEQRQWGLVVMEWRALEALLKRSPPRVWGDFARRLLRLVQRARPPERGEQARWAYRLRMLLLELSEKAPQVTGIANNRTEQMIGRGFKVRVKSMRGFKRAEHCLRYLHLALALDERAQREGRLYLI